jgi:hypothetical protein
MKVWFVLERDFRKGVVVIQEGIFVGRDRTGWKEGTDLSL